MAKNILIEVSKDEEARAYYESELIFELDQNGKMNHAKREGIREGMAEAEKKYEMEIKSKDDEIKKLKEELNKYKML